jgi:hypothetical protein
MLRFQREKASGEQLTNKSVESYSAQQKSGG